MYMHRHSDAECVQDAWLLGFVLVVLEAEDA
jgi:hypothetical protein